MNKIKKSYIEVDSSTDHSFITVEKMMKINQIEENFIITRNFKNIDFNILNQNIIDSEYYLEMLQDDNSSRICSNLIKMIQSEYDKFSPIIKLKIKNENESSNSKSTNEFIKRKNNAYKAMKQDYTTDNIREYKNLVKLTRKLIKIDKM